MYASIHVDPGESVPLEITPQSLPSHSYTGPVTLQSLTSSSQ